MNWTVTYVNATDRSVDVEAPADATREQLIAAGDEAFAYPGLCHQCGHERNDGDWEPRFAVDENGTELDLDPEPPAPE